MYEKLFEYLDHLEETTQFKFDVYEKISGLRIRINLGELLTGIIIERHNIINELDDIERFKKSFEKLLKGIEAMK